MDLERYNSLIQSIFQRFPSVQTSSFNDAYKPGLQHMLDFNAALGGPDKAFRTIHVAGICTSRNRAESGTIHVAPYIGFP